jgi:3-phenylpropionate/trans-cinnamate dioxygenase ferredoxin reductase subunit
MTPQTIVIVGGGPSGLSTARSYREHGGTGHVTLVSEEPHLPYERPPLTKQFLRGELDQRELALEQEGWFAEHDVQLLRGATVAAIEPASRAVTLEDTRRLRADTIVLATGSQPLRPDLPGLDDAAVLTMRSLSDSLAIARRARESGTAIVIGLGFIGCEIAASLAMLGVDVVLVGREPAPQAERLGQEAGELIAAWLADLGVQLIAGVNVTAVHDASTVELRDGKRIAGGCVVLGMGVRPRAALAERAGLALHEGAVAVDSSMRASGAASDVFAVGDLAFAQNTSAGRALRVEHWGDALGHGEVAGRTLAGEDAHWSDVPGFWSTIGERTLKYAAWGDGFDEARLQTHAPDAFTVWYSRAGVAVGVVSQHRDED